MIDLQKFITTFTGPISQSAPHIYLSALPFAPPSSTISKQYNHQYPEGLKIEIGGLHEWPAIQNVFHGHAGAVTSIAFSPDGRHIASGSWDNTIRIWDAETGKVVTGPLEGHTGSVWSVAFSPDGRHVASGSYDHTIRIWDVETGAHAHAFDGHTGNISSVALSPDSQFKASVSSNEALRIHSTKVQVSPHNCAIMSS